MSIQSRLRLSHDFEDFARDRLGARPFGLRLLGEPTTESFHGKQDRSARPHMGQRREELPQGTFPNPKRPGGLRGP